ncbi:MAG: LysR substrate-binding domain-containing protein, partial [Limnohabitans sp.]
TQNKAQTQPRDGLHVGAVSPAHYFLPPLLKAFRQGYPMMTVKLTVARRTELLEMLLNRRIDMAITGYPPSDAELEAVQFARHPHVMVARPDHALAQSSCLTWEALQTTELIVRERGSATRMFFEQLLQAHQHQGLERTEMSSNEAVKQAVVCGMGVSFLSAHVCQTEIQAGYLVTLNLPDMPKHIDWCVIHPRNTEPVGLALAFKQFVVNSGGSYCECVFTKTA